MEKQICLITGATDGIGKITATEMARKGYTVVLVARNEKKAEAVKREIISSTNNKNIEFIIADLASLKQIHQMAAIYKARYSKLDVLINNAGIFMSEREITADGYEKTYQVNYLSQFIITNLLLDELKRSDGGRIVNLSSSVYNMGKFDVNNLQSEKKFSTMNSYANTKLYTQMFTIELAERLSGRLTVNSVHPGIVRTQMMLSATGLFKVVSYLAMPFSITPEKGAATSVYVATSDDVRNLSGKYFTNSKVTPVKNKFNTPENRQLLWDLSMSSLKKSKETGKSTYTTDIVV